MRKSGRPRALNERAARQLAGLSVEETREFELLERLPPLDDDGVHIAWTTNGQATTTRERRWLELHQKHEHAKQLQRVANHVRGKPG